MVLELPLDQAKAVVMTLPHLLARAVRRRTGNDEARYVFGLHEWSIEAAKDNKCLITTLKTTNGFEVSFGIPFEACQSLGWNLQNGAERAIDAGELSEESFATGRVKFNRAACGLSAAIEATVRKWPLRNYDSPCTGACFTKKYN